ncbi:hypothetical protein D9V32_07880 [Mycetocola tolaasinivorans]|uniref:Uncharacterized protein n=2 Tax=Mycetocola tolaasinivorans TaxID=76635 RepID=A0A3L7A6V4_9MICO|nr:hypothetical protein D9V32_07880 [Mycetocola tolaasinivorans]
MTRTTGTKTGFRALLFTRGEAMTRRGFRLLLTLLWAITVLGTLGGFAVQAMLGARVWSEIPGAFLPVFLGATIGFGIALIATRLDSDGSPSETSAR